MIIDISDPEIAKAYQSITKDGSKDWLVLGYSKARDALRLVDSGSGGLEAVRSHVKAHSNDVNFSLVQASGPGSLALVCFIPPAVGGVKRARAIVHSRAVEDVFPARRAVVNIASETELTPASVEHALRSHVPITRGPNLEPRLPAGGLQRPMSPPDSSEEGRGGYNAMPRVPSSSSSLMRERGLPLNLAEPLDHEREQELASQNIKPVETLAPKSGGIAPERRASSPKNGKPKLSVSVPPRKERGLRPMSYDGGDAYEFDASGDDEDDDNQNDSDQDEEQEGGGQGDDSLVVRINSRPSSRGATPPPGPSILRHPSPRPSKSELLGPTVALGSLAHIRFTGPPKDHPHPNHHPLKPTDVIITDKPPPSRPQVDGLPNTDKDMNSGSMSIIPGLPSSSSTGFQQSTDTPPRPLGNSPPLQDHLIQVVPSNTSRTSTTSDQSKSPQATAVAPSLLPSSITCPPTSQPGPSVPPPDSINYPPPPEGAQASQMPPPRLPSLRESFGPSFERALPLLPQATASAISSTSSSIFPGSSSLGAHSRNGSLSTTGQTHVPSGTLSAFGRRPSVSNTPQGANGSTTPGSISRMQLEQMSPSALMERSSTTNTATTSSSAPSLRSFTVQTQGMTEAQAQAARSRAKWAAEEQGLTIPQSTPTPPLPRSPPLTPPISPPRSLNADEAGRVRRDGVEKMRREAERRREEDEKRRLAELQRQAEAEQQVKLDEERKAREVKDRAAQEERRRAAELQRRVTEEELGKRRAEEKNRVREKFAEVQGTDEVFLSGYVNIQVQNSTTWRRRFYELTAAGSLRLFKSSDPPDCVKPLDMIVIKGARSINRNVDELELIPYAFQVQLAGGTGVWSFYADSQHDMDILTEGMTWVIKSSS